MEWLLLLVGGLISWIIAHFYYRRSSSNAPDWVKPLIESFEQASQRAEAAGLLATAAQSAEVTEFSFELVAKEDPALALAGLRIEIEKRLVQLARGNNLTTSHAGVRRLLRILGERGLLSAEENSVLADLVGLLNSAVHGGKVDDRVAVWAINAGRRLLVALDRRVARSQ
jgi:hypothetical protein